MRDNKKIINEYGRAAKDILKIVEVQEKQKVKKEEVKNNDRCNQSSICGNC